MAKEKKVKTGVGALARELILAGRSNAEVLAAIQKKFPESKATSGTVGWYRNNLKAAGKKVKDSRDITAAAKKAATPKAPKKAAKAAKAPKAAPTADAAAEAATETLV